jgi:prepilin-type N-terminal cleavage/methylation domain-containing protein
MKRQQAGFTLVEIAIVLVIIGLLLGGILKGQEMINSGKIKSVINDMKAVSVAYYSYQDRYRAIPGDDNAASTRLNGAVSGNGDGIITAANVFNAVTNIGAPGAATESNKFWQHTRMAGFMSGVATALAALPPANGVGGVVGVEDAAYAMTGAVVCASLVPLSMAQSMDISIDDGISASGTFRTGAAAAIPTGPVGILYDVTNPTGLATVCQKI